MKNLFLFVALLASSNCLAENITGADPQFSFTGAEAAFSTAQAPSGESLPGDWMMVGLVAAPGMDQTNSGYWPSGKHPIPGRTGMFYEFVTITKSEDSFGSTIYLNKDRIVGAESGKVYYTGATHSGVIASTGYRFTMAQTDETCGQRVECRVVPAKSLQLCQVAMVDPRETCSQYPANTPLMYIGYRKKN